MKKTLKKSLSILLSMLMIFSAMQMSISVFAEEATTSLVDEINAFEGKLDTETPDADVLSAYNDITSKYKALSAEEKETFDVIAFDKLYHKVIDREKFLYKQANPSSKTAEQSEKAHLAADKVLGLPAFLTEAVALNSVLADKKATVDEKVAAFGNASANAQIYANLYYGSYKMFNYNVSSYPSKTFGDLIKTISGELVKADPFPGGRPQSPSSPRPNNYPLGRDDPDYIAAYAKYLEEYKDYQIANVAYNNHTCAKNLEAIKTIAVAAPAYANIANVVELAFNGKASYDADTTQKTTAAQAVEAYNALSDLEKLQLEKLSTYLYYVLKQTTTSWSYDSYTAAKLVTACVDIGNAKFVDDFVAVVNEITEPYTRADITAVKAAYALVPASLQGTVDSEVLAKYKAILAAIGPDEQSTELPDLIVYEHTDVKYPAGTSKTSVENDVYDIYNLVLKALKTNETDIGNTVQKKIYSSEFVGSLAKLIYPALGGLNSMVAYSPADLANKLTEANYSKAAEKLNAAVSLDENGKVIKNMEDWDKVAFTNGDFGFEDGDREAFLDAASAIFRPLSIITLVLSLENNVNTTNGTYTYGAYEELIPVFEALDLKGVMSSDEYTKYVKAADSDMKMDARIRPILVPVANLIDEFAAAPLDTVLDVLPKLGYALKEDIVNTQINKVLSMMKMISIAPIDLTTGGIFDIIIKELAKIEVRPAVTDENGNVITEAVKLNLTLSKDAFIKVINDLSGCGEYVAKPSVSRESAYRAGIESDKTDAFMVLWNYLYGEIKQADNMAIIKELVGTSDNRMVGLLMNMAFNLIEKLNSGAVIMIVGKFMPLFRCIIALYQLIFTIMNFFDFIK